MARLENPSDSRQLDELGEPVGIGRTAQVYAWRDGEILKLLRHGFPDQLGEREAEIAARVDAAGLAAPRFLGTTRIDGRYGLLYERLRGPSMLDQLTGRPWLVDVLARRFAALHARMHETSGAGLPDHKAYYELMIKRAAGELGDSRRDRALAWLEELPDGSAVCHGDMHPGNVIVTGSGPVVIDWLTACSGPPEMDVARTLFLLAGSVVPDAYPRLQRALIGTLRRRFAGTYLRAYRRLRRIDDAQLARWRLPVLAGRLAEGIADEQPALLARIDMELTGSGA